MTVLFRRTFTRPNNSVPFYVDTPEFTQYIADTYVDSGQCLAWRDSTEDSLTKTTESTWVSQDDVNAAVVDAQILANSASTIQHCEANLIDMVTVIE